MPDNQNNRYIDFIQYVESLKSEDGSDMLLSRVIPSFFHTIHRHGFLLFSEDALKQWIIDMLIEGLRPSTVRRYVGTLHTSFKEWAKKSEEDYLNDSVPVFDFNRILSPILDDYKVEDAGKTMADVEKNLKAIDNLIKVSGSPVSRDFVANRAFQFLLFNPGASLADVIDAKFSDSYADYPHIEDVVVSMRNAPQAKYVFPLFQGKKRLPAIQKELVAGLRAAGLRSGLSFGSSFSRDSITNIWIAAALREGIPVEEIAAVVRPLPELYSFLSTVEPASLSDSDKTELINRVADSIANKSTGWFVAKLRLGVSPEKITERLKEIKSPLLKQIQFYYPLRTVKKMENKKVVSVETPVLPGLLFFRMPYDKVTNLMAKIGDMAWCYRTSSNPSSPYSIISQEEMRSFQRTVGSFTSDIEMEIISSLPALNVGDEVMIEDGSMLDGQQATIRKVRSVDGSLTYTLRLSDTAFIRWKEVEVAASSLSKI